MPLTTSNVSYMAGSRRIDGYLARPEEAGPFPAVIVIHEAYGLNDNMREIARRFAELGYAALAVDLFTGRNQALCLFRYMSGSLFNPLRHSGISELQAALTYLSDQPEVDKERVGAIGFCMGGSLCIAWACTDARLKVIAPFYGANPRPEEALARICPVVGSYPDKDFTASHGKKLDVLLDRYAIPHDIKIYPDTKHSFFNDQGSHYAAAASQDAWERIQRFFGERLGSSLRG